MKNQFYKMSHRFVKNIDVDSAILPNRPLTNFELDEAAKKLYIACYRAAFVRDEVPKRLRCNKCGILNLDDSSGKGSHWVAWFKKGCVKLYFTLTVMGYCRLTSWSNT